MVRSNLVFVLLIMLIITGCSHSTYSSDFIYDAEKIDMIKIQGVSKSNSIDDYSLEDLSTIKKILSLVDNIEVIRLGANEEVNVLDSGKKLQQYGNYILSLTNTKENDSKESLCGVIVVLEEGKLIFTDIKTITDGKRTISYISTGDVSNIVKDRKSVV